MYPSSTAVVPLDTCDKLFPRSPVPQGPCSKGVQHWKQGGNPLHPQAITSGILLPLPCQHPALGTPPALIASFSVLQRHPARTKTTRLCKLFPPGRDSVRQRPGAPCPRLCRCHRWPAGVRAREGNGGDRQGAGTDGQGPGGHRQVGEEAGTNGWGTGEQGSSGQGTTMDRQGRSNYEEETGRDEQK